MFKRIALVCVALMAVSATASADIGVSAKVGGLGAGVEVTQYYNDMYSARLGVGQLKVSKDFDEDGVNYKGDLKVGGVNLFGDIHPFHGGFRVTGGIVKMDTGLKGEAKFDGSGSIDINGNTYTSADVSSVNADVKWNKVRPYIGIGYDGGNTDKDGGFFLTTDFGIIYAGKASVSVTANCINAGVCAALDADLAAQKQKIEDGVGKMKVIPVGQVTVGYKF